VKQITKISLALAINLLLFGVFQHTSAKRQEILDLLKIQKTIDLLEQKMLRTQDEVMKQIELSKIKLVEEKQKRAKKVELQKQELQKELQLQAKLEQREKSILKELNNQLGRINKVSKISHKRIG